MHQATFRFYEELNDYLPEEKRKRDFPVSFGPGSTVRDILASLGIPYDEVDLILVNGVPVGLAITLEGGERISVYPVFESFDIRPCKGLGCPPLRQLKFVTDRDLGKLAGALRLFGLDTLHEKTSDSRQLIGLSETEGRVLLTRSRRLLEDKRITRGILVKGKDVKAQLLDIFRRLDLYGAVQPFSRCLECNEMLEPATEEDKTHAGPARMKESRATFAPCPLCNRVHREEGHFGRTSSFVRELFEAGPENRGSSC